jgi:N-acyl-D-aspartate/D-glutamate deacylase
MGFVCGCVALDSLAGFAGTMFRGGSAEVLHDKATATEGLFAATLACRLWAAPEPPLITNARIVDAGNPWYRGSLLIRGNRIAAVGAKIQVDAGRVIDAGGQIVCPGFIDVHNHCDKGLLEFPDGQQALRQGVTTLVGGPCGGGVVDVGAALRQMDRLPLGPNVCLLAGFNAMRSRCLKGSQARPATEEEIQRICALMEKAMQEGAVGMSSSPKYAPFTATAELIAAAKVVARYGGIHMSHIREEGRGVVEAVAELIRISRESGVPGDISHHKVTGLEVRGRARPRSDGGRGAGRGPDITLDQYPYTASSTGFSVCCPPGQSRDARPSRPGTPTIRPTARSCARPSSIS